MKALLLSLFILPQTETFTITFQTLNYLKKPVTAKVKIYHEDAFIKEYYSTGFFVTKLPEGDYKVEVLSCDTTSVLVHADMPKTAWLLVNDDCGTTTE